MDLKGIFFRRSKLFITITGFVLVVIIGIIDYLSGPVYSSLVAYLIPVIFVTRLAGRTAGITMSALSSAVWIIADILAVPDHTFLMVNFWNLLEKLGVFLIVVFILLKLARVEEERKDMLSMLAHDMKNPAMVAKGFSTRLLMGKTGQLSERQGDYVRLIHDELSRLEQLIHDFLDRSRLESKEFKLHLEPVDILMTAKNHIEALRVEADKKNIHMVLECPDGGVPRVSADAVLVDRVIRNLASNAIKYTGEGGTVTLKFLVKSRYIIVQVRDTGRGIPAEHIKRVFKPFHRVKNDPGGTGLGLPVAQSIVKAHGGDIWVDSIPGKGSTFSFTLPRVRSGRRRQSS